ncbi:Acyl- N-acyltransferase [Fusarium albosuccineum]|uniref:Acyl- N-acyltransferase n=1 Tax=Fusarium albosuccineum TaxID=1237068 RepID=A0A8H4NQZ4_9HYPO|nr:Acyl- N-acyltransferase [Fusarium albosuccineum]
MTNNNLEFRTATPDDAPQLQQLIQSAFRAEDSRKDWVGDADLAANFRLEVDEIMPGITKPDSAFLVAIDSSGGIVATIGVAKRGPDVARFFMLAVDQGRHRGGIGRQVLGYAEDYCQRVWGVDKIGLDALSVRKELIAWYLRCGFRKTGELTPFPADKINGRAVGEDLYFVEMEKDLKTGSD